MRFSIKQKIQLYLLCMPALALTVSHAMADSPKVELDDVTYSQGKPAPAYIAEQLGPFGLEKRVYLPPVGAIYVAPDGLEANSGGSVEEPTTIEKAISLATTGDTIVLRGGEYRTGDLRFSRQITLQAYRDERPAIIGSEIAKDWERRGDYWVTKWATMFRNEPPQWYKPDRHGPPWIWNGDLVRFNGVMGIPVGSREELEAQRFYCDYENGEIYISENPEELEIEITRYAHGLIREHGEGADPIGPTFLGLDVMHYAFSCITIEGDDPYRLIEPYEMPAAPIRSRVENCRILFCSKTGIVATTANAYFGHNEFAMHGLSAMMIRMSHNTVFENNLVTRSNYYVHMSYPAGIKIFNQGYNFKVRNNHFSEMRCVAAWYDVGLHDGVIMKNYFQNCGKGLKIEISHHMFIAGNVFENSNMFICNSADSYVYNNTLIGSRLDFMRNNRGLNWNKLFSFNHAATGPGISGYHGHKIANNVFAGMPKGGFYSLIEDNNEHDTQFQTAVLDQNVFLAEAAGPFKAQFQPEHPEMVDYATLEDFLKVYGAYAKDNVELDITTEGLFRDATVGDYRLKGSPDLPAGLPIPEPIAKRLGWEPAKKGVGAFAQP